MRGEVETIVAKALEKDRDRRYRSAAALADDVRRYLNGEAIQARPPSMVYNLRVFARRNKGLVGGVAAVFVVLAAGVVVSTSLYLRSETARDEATVVKDVFVGALEKIDPNLAPGQVADIREWLDQIAADIETDPKLRHYPLAEADLRTTVGRTYRHLGHYDEADPHLTAALAMRRRLLDREDANVLSGAYELGLLRFRQGKHAEAHRLFVEVIKIHKTAALPDSRALAASLREFTPYQWGQGNYDEAERMLHRSKEMFIDLIGPENLDVAWCLNNLGIIEHQRRDLDKAEDYHLKSLAMRTKTLGEDHPHVWWSYFNLSMVYVGKEDSKQVVHYRRQGWNLCERTLGDHPWTVHAQRALGRALRNDEIDLVEAEDLFRGALAMQKKLVPEPSPEEHWAVELRDLALLLRDKGGKDALTEAVELMTEAVEQFDAAPNPPKLDPRQQLKEMEDKLDRYSEAQE